MKWSTFRRTIIAATVPALTILVFLAARPRTGEVPLTHPSRFAGWWLASGPTIATFGLIRLMVFAGGLCWTSLVVFFLVARWTGHLGLVTAACQQRTWIGLGWMARLLAGTSIASASLVSGTTCSQPVSLGDLATLVASDVGSASATPPGPPTPPRLVPLSPATAEPSARDVPAVALPPAAPVPVAVGPPALANSTSTSPGQKGIQLWIVESGDDLWSIAASVMESDLGYSPSNREIAPYWLRLIEANRPSLPDPDNPSLIFAGERITLPPR